MQIIIIQSKIENCYPKVFFFLCKKERKIETIIKKKNKNRKNKNKLADKI